MTPVLAAAITDRVVIEPSLGSASLRGLTLGGAIGETFRSIRSPFNGRRKGRRRDGQAHVKPSTKITTPSFRAAAAMPRTVGFAGFEVDGSFSSSFWRAQCVTGPSR